MMRKNKGIARIRAFFSKLISRALLLAFFAFFVLAISLALFTPKTFAATDSSFKIIFDGYYKILAGQRHIGFVVHQYRFSEKKKRFQSIHYIKTNALAGNQTESLNAMSDDRFFPISFQFTQTVGKKVKLIDAKFKGLTMHGTISDGVKKTPFRSNFPKGSFLSTFLVPLMMSQGVETDKRFRYSGIAEEVPKALTGDAYVKKEMSEYKGQKVFKVLNIYKGEKFFFYLSPDGEYLGSSSPAQQISTELVAQPIEATKGIKVNLSHLRQVFGTVPGGQLNSIASPKAAQKSPPPPPEKKPHKLVPIKPPKDPKKKGP